MVTAHYCWTEKKKAKADVSKMTSLKKTERKHKGLDGKDGFCVQKSELSHGFPASNKASFSSVNTTLLIFTYFKKKL